ncbi:hypothetical protein [Chryseobacterium wanjuense]
MTLLFLDRRKMFSLQQNYRKEKLIEKWNLKNLVPYNEDSVLFCVGDGLVKYNFVEDTYSKLLKERTYTALPYSKDSMFVGNFKDLFKFNTNTKQKTYFWKGIILLI